MKQLSSTDRFRLAGIITFVILLIIVSIALIPLIEKLAQPSGFDHVVTQVRNAGPLGALILLGFQFLQIVVAFIPGEVVQVAAGAMFGPWVGALIIVAGSVISSIFVYMVVHRLGAPFVRAMIPASWMSKLDDFEKSERLDIMVFILFLIPGLPKDAFTYLVPLTRMKMRDFVLISNIGRIPGVLMSTFAASGLVDGDYRMSIILFTVSAAIAGLALLLHEKVFKALTLLGIRKDIQHHTDIESRV